MGNRHNIEKRWTGRSYRKGGEQISQIRDKANQATDKKQADNYNACEHCLEPAPEGKRFCSQGCCECEHDVSTEDGCSGICLS